MGFRDNNGLAYTCEFQHTRTRNKYNGDKCRDLHFLYAVGKRKNDTLWNVPVKIKNHQFMRKSHQGGTIS